jgi:predicted hotdog family 3-hydroxylacyl-ACP dehydratase
MTGPDATPADASAVATVDALYDRLPHAGAMRLLEQVLAWDRHAIRCATASHRARGNPLRRDRRLSTVHGIEYGAQAAAIHGVLSSVLDRGPVLLLAAVRDLELPVPRLDTLPAPLVISARLEARVGANAVYRFRLEVAAPGGTDQCCASGSLTLMEASGGAP